MTNQLYKFYWCQLGVNANGRFGIDKNQFGFIYSTDKIHLKKNKVVKSERKREFLSKTS